MKSWLLSKYNIISNSCSSSGAIRDGYDHSTRAKKTFIALSKVKCFFDKLRASKKLKEETLFM